MGCDNVVPATRLARNSILFEAHRENLRGFATEEIPANLTTEEVGRKAVR